MPHAPSPHRVVCSPLWHRLPYGYNKCGLYLSGLFLIIICFLAYVTATFEVEAMSISNKLIHQKLEEVVPPGMMNDADGFTLKKRAEMGQMAELVRPRSA